MPEGWSYDAHLDRFVKVRDSSQSSSPSAQASHGVHVPKETVHHIHVVHGDDVTFHQPSATEKYSFRWP